MPASFNVQSRETPGRAMTIFNCECDAPWPSQTLAQMRRYVFVKLGYAANSTYPPGMAETIDDFIRDAQEISYSAYPGYRTSRFFTWNMVTGERFYDFDANSDTCQLKINPDEIEWVGISQDQNFWRPLRNGIRPEFYFGDIQGWPTHYEFRQCIEVWPAPADDTWKLRIKGNFGLRPLTLDTDTSTIDPFVIRLLATANAKSWRGQADASNYMTWWQNVMGDLVASGHGTRRYIPDNDQWVPPPLPVLTGYPGGLP